MPEEAVTVPATGFGVRIGGGHAMRQREQQRHGVFGGADGVLVRCIGDENAGFGSGFDVDIVESGARPRNNEQLPRRAQHIARDSRLVAHDQCARIANALSQQFGVLPEFRQVHNVEPCRESVHRGAGNAL